MNIRFCQNLSTLFTSYPKEVPKRARHLTTNSQAKLVLVALLASDQLRIDCLPTVNFSDGVKATQCSELNSPIDRKRLHSSSQNQRCSRFFLVGIALSGVTVL